MLPKAQLWNRWPRCCPQSARAYTADHGKTTLVDAMLKQSKVFRDNQAVQVRFRQGHTRAGLDDGTRVSGTRVV